jgi:hypothetical protein
VPLSLLTHASKKRKDQSSSSVLSMSLGIGVEVKDMSTAALTAACRVPTSLPLLHEKAQKEASCAYS